MAAPTRRIRPWHALVLVVGVLGVLYSLVFVTGQAEPTPRFGVDLQGGTRITLTPLVADGQAPPRQSLDQARHIIEERADALGIGGAEVVLEGSDLTVTVPGSDSDAAAGIVQRGNLHFRPVLNQQYAAAHDGERLAAAGDAEQVRQLRAFLQSPDPQVQQKALSTVSCAVPNPLGGSGDPDLPLVTCDRGGSIAYLLGPAVLSADQIVDASAEPRADGTHRVNLELDRAGDGVWSRYTVRNAGQQVAVVLDGAVLAAPQIQRPVPLGELVRISADFSDSDADELVALVDSGPLPLSFVASEPGTVSAALGPDTVRAVLIAGVVGLAAVCLSTLAYYRLFGLLAILSFTSAGLLIYASLVLAGRWFGVTVDLAALAGLLVAVALIADSFVVLAERLKDETRPGRSFGAAVPLGWPRVRRTVVSASGVVFAGAAILGLVGAGPVANFGVVLGVSAVSVVVVTFLVIHPLVSMAAGSRLAQGGGSP